MPSLGTPSRAVLLSILPLLVSHCGSHSASAPGGSDADSLSDAAAALAVDCGTRTHTAGQTFRTLSVQGTNRTYYAYLPASLDATTPVPFVFVTHGALMDAADMIAVTQYEALADSEGIAVAFLDGQGTSSMTGTETLDPWNVSDNGAAVCGAGDLANNHTAGVDFDFMDAVEADVALDQCLDTAHIFATGFSMGGYFTHHIGCDRTDVRAVAPHSGATIASLSACKTGHVPAIIFHGTSDPVIEEGCDDPNGTAQSGFPPSATLWAQKNGCASTYSTATDDGDGGGDGQCYLYDGCPADGQVELCTFTGMGHCWAGGAPDAGAQFACPTYASATQLEWAFFKKYAW
jgi:poly(3-hydroxybutyrate) depolymerase